MRSGARRLSPVKRNSRLCFPAGIVNAFNAPELVALVESLFVSRVESGVPSMRSSSSTGVGSGLAVLLADGSATTIPFAVENQRWQDLVFKPDGKKPLVHSSEGIPSGRP